MTAQTAMRHQYTIRKGTSGPKRWCYTITGPRLNSPLEGARAGTKREVESHIKATIRRIEGNAEGGWSGNTIRHQSKTA